jgi:hypothetical protein
MKIQCHEKDLPLIRQFLSRWEGDSLLGYMDECDPVYFDTDSPEELANVFMELERVGFTQSVKRIFTGDHFYRSDTGKCPRCYRHRPEIHWNNENMCDASLCDRCADVMKERRNGEE